jgi:endoglucanase
VETEGSWNNPPVVESTFDDAKRAGFKGIRLPVTWAYHFTSQSPDWTVDPVWLQRVSDVVDMITSRGLYTLVNVHHDSWTWADLTKAETNVTEVEERLSKLWYQIGVKLACKSELVAFETINEIPGTTAEHGAVINRLNNIFLQAINDAGGHNPMRVVTLVGAGEDGLKTTQWFERPDAKFKNPWGIQYHYYSPCNTLFPPSSYLSLTDTNTDDYVFNAWGKSTWGSDADKASLEADIALVRGNFSDIPIIIGEWAVSPVATETAARWRYFDFFVRTAAKYNTSTILWDNGADFLDRATHQWRDQVAIDIYQNAVQGIPNALPLSTTDASSTSQQSSAYIYYRSNSTISNVTLPFDFNGNTLQSISLGNDQLTQGKDYTVSPSSSITFSASYLAQILTPTAPTGSLANLTLAFSTGADLQINILKYATPTLSTTTFPLPAAGTDLLIPITWAGQNRPATVKAIKADGSFLVDEWTEVLGVLQAGRMTYGGQWDWNAEGVLIKSGALDAVRTAGMDTVFTLEFYPREEGNTVEVTVTV